MKKGIKVTKKYRSKNWTLKNTLPFYAKSIMDARNCFYSLFFIGKGYVLSSNQRSSDRYH